MNTIQSEARELNERMAAACSRLPSDKRGEYERKAKEIWQTLDAQARMKKESGQWLETAAQEADTTDMLAEWRKAQAQLESLLQSYEPQNTRTSQAIPAAPRADSYDAVPAPPPPLRSAPAAPKSRVRMPTPAPRATPIPAPQPPTFRPRPDYVPYMGPGPAVPPKQARSPRIPPPPPIAEEPPIPRSAAMRDSGDYERRVQALGHFTHTPAQAEAFAKIFGQDSLSTEEKVKRFTIRNAGTRNEILVVTGPDPEGRIITVHLDRNGNQVSPVSPKAPAREPTLAPPRAPDAAAAKRTPARTPAAPSPVPSAPAEAPATRVKGAGDNMTPEVAEAIRTLKSAVDAINSQPWQSKEDIARLLGRQPTFGSPGAEYRIAERRADGSVVVEYTSGSAARAMFGAALEPRFGRQKGYLILTNEKVRGGSDNYLLNEGGTLFNREALLDGRLFTAAELQLVHSVDPKDRNYAYFTHPTIKGIAERLDHYQSIDGFAFDCGLKSLPGIWKASPHIPQTPDHDRFVAHFSEFYKPEAHELYVNYLVKISGLEEGAARTLVDRLKAGRKVPSAPPAATAAEAEPKTKAPEPTLAKPAAAPKDAPAKSAPAPAAAAPESPKTSDDGMQMNSREEKFKIEDELGEESRNGRGKESMKLDALGMPDLEVPKYEAMENVVREAQKLNITLFKDPWKGGAISILHHGRKFGGIVTPTKGSSATELILTPAQFILTLRKAIRYIKEGPKVIGDHIYIEELGNANRNLPKEYAKLVHTAFLKGIRIREHRSDDGVLWDITDRLDHVIGNVSPVSPAKGDWQKTLVDILTKAVEAPEPAPAKTAEPRGAPAPKEKPEAMDATKVRAFFGNDPKVEGGIVTLPAGGSTSIETGKNGIVRFPDGIEEIRGSLVFPDDNQNQIVFPASLRRIAGDVVIGHSAMPQGLKIQSQGLEITGNVRITNHWAGLHDNYHLVENYYLDPMHAANVRVGGKIFLNADSDAVVRLSKTPRISLESLKKKYPEYSFGNFDDYAPAPVPKPEAKTAAPKAAPVKPADKPDAQSDIDTKHYLDLQKSVMRSAEKFPAPVSGTYREGDGTEPGAQLAKYHAELNKLDPFIRSAVDLILVNAISKFSSSDGKPFVWMVDGQKIYLGVKEVPAKKPAAKPEAAAEEQTKVTFESLTKTLNDLARSIGPDTRIVPWATSEDHYPAVQKSIPVLSKALQEIVKEQGADALKGIGVALHGDLEATAGPADSWMESKLIAVLPSQSAEQMKKTIVDGIFTMRAEAALGQACNEIAYKVGAKYIGLRKTLKDSLKQEQISAFLNVLQQMKQAPGGDRKFKDISMILDAHEGAAAGSDLDYITVLPTQSAEAVKKTIEEGIPKQRKKGEVWDSLIKLERSVITPTIFFNAESVEQLNNVQRTIPVLRNALLQLKQVKKANVLEDVTLHIDATEHATAGVIENALEKKHIAVLPTQSAEDMKKTIEEALLKFSKSKEKSAPKPEAAPAPKAAPAAPAAPKGTELVREEQIQKSR
ncbi:MAG: hypothetical protein V1876_03320, partial [Candidatus Peregrinibacteria bacterium]